MLDAYKVRSRIRQEILEVPGICIVGARRFINLLVYADALNSTQRRMQGKTSILNRGNREFHE